MAQQQQQQQQQQQPGESMAASRQVTPTAEEVELLLSQASIEGQAAGVPSTPPPAPGPPAGTEQWPSARSAVQPLARERTAVPSTRPRPSPLPGATPSPDSKAARTGGAAAGVRGRRLDFGRLAPVEQQQQPQRIMLEQQLLQQLQQLQQIQQMQQLQQQLQQQGQQELQLLRQREQQVRQRERQVEQRERQVEQREQRMQQREQRLAALTGWLEQESHMAPPPQPALPPPQPAPPLQQQPPRAAPPLQQQPPRAAPPLQQQQQVPAQRQPLIIIPETGSPFTASPVQRGTAGPSRLWGSRPRHLGKVRSRHQRSCLASSRLCRRSSSRNQGTVMRTVVMEVRWSSRHSRARQPRSAAVSSTGTSCILHWAAATEGTGSSPSDSKHGMGARVCYSAPSRCTSHTCCRQL